MKKRPISDYYTKNSNRLTKSGFRKLSEKQKGYFINLPHPLNAKQLAQLGRLIDFPYYISSRLLVIFSDEDTFWLRLNGDDIANWLDSLEDQ